MISCPRCGLIGLSGIRQVLLHLASVHSCEPNFHVVCNFPKAVGSCCSVFTSVSSFRSHIYKFHSSLMFSEQHDNCTVRTEILCPVCGNSLNSLRDVTSHYREHCQQGIPVHCLVKHCDSSFTVISSYTAHMSCMHQNVSVDSLRVELVHQVRAEQSEVCTDMVTSSDVDIDVDEDDEVQDIDRPNVTRNIALLFLKMKAQYCLADSTTQAIIDDFAQAFAVSHAYASHEIRSVCAKHGLSASATENLIAAGESGMWNKALSELSTDYKRNNFYKENFPFVNPCEYKFVDDCNCTETFQFVSILDSLKILLKNEEVRTHIMNPPAQMDGHLASFRDGNLYKNHPVFSQVECGLEIILYSDEFELVNPLGPHKKKHKLMAFYFTLGNFHQRCKSQMSAMFLVLLCKSSSIQKHGFSAIAVVINRELSILENDGIVVDGYPSVIRGALTFIAGDNLNSNLIGGFNASFSPNVNYLCRFCLTSNLEMPGLDDAGLIRNRTRENYEQHVRDVESEPNRKSVFGIKYKSPFICGSFHVVEGLPPDIMHDLLEGVVPFELALVLKCLIAKKYFSLDDLNHCILSWPYGSLDKANKPVEIAASFGESIKQNAGRTWCLLRLLPLMVGPKVPADDEHWNFFLALKDIVEIAFAPRLALGHVLLLQTKIQNHIATFNVLFCDNALKPKHHFMLHYPRYFLLFGNLRLCWCMRFESKHYYFTRLTRVVNNYKNICSTLAQRHQMQLAYHLASDNAFLEHNVSMSCTVNADMNYLSDSVVDALQQNNVSRSDPLHQCKFVSVNGLTYRCRMYVITDFDSNSDTPVFGRIDNIFIQQMKVHFLLRICKSIYDSHLSSYLLHVTDSITVRKVEQLLDCYPLSSYVVGLNRFVVLKNFVYSHSLFS